jgi:hypothetical protein
MEHGQFKNGADGQEKYHIRVLMKKRHFLNRGITAGPHDTSNRQLLGKAAEPHHKHESNSRHGAAESKTARRIRASNPANIDSMPGNETPMALIQT